MSRYITTKADFTLRRKHKTGSGYTIYENDYTTINPMPNALKGDYVIGDSNFVFTTRLGLNSQRRHVRGKFVAPPIENEASAWTIETIIDSGITNETKIRLNPNYSSIKDFACYGSAVKLIQGTINGVIREFPAEIWLSDNEMDKITLYNYGGRDGCNPGGFSFIKQKFDSNGDPIDGTAISTKNQLYNEYGIDIITLNVQEDSVDNPLRYFALCGSSYSYYEMTSTGEIEYKFESYSVDNHGLGECAGGKSVEVDYIAEVTLTFEKNHVITIDVYKDNTTKELYYLYEGGEGGHIRPKKQIVENYFRDCDDFTAVLLDRISKPIYSVTLETPRETETGYIYFMKNYTWPTLNGGYNPDLSSAYYSYVESLIALGEFYDEYWTDNMWRSLTHEAIKTLDWTYISNDNGDIEDMSTIDTSRIEPITKIYGRQFDDLKRYADGIKSINRITYDHKSNTPDYTLTDVLENSGWETKTLKITSDKDIYTETLYSGLTSGYTTTDASNEFIRRMKLNSSYLTSIKGTRKGLDTMLALFGFTPGDYDIAEYVYVFEPNSEGYSHFCDTTQKIADNAGSTLPKYPLAKDISTINKYKVNFNSLDPYGDYCGIPVAEIGYFSGETNYSYVVPWFSYGKTYDDGLYFQMSGGWGRRNDMDVEVDIPSGDTIAHIATTIKDTPEVPLYWETEARLKFAKDFDDLLQAAYDSSSLHDVFYVTDISRLDTDDYNKKEDEDLENASHYFVLEDVDLYQYLGYYKDEESENGKYGWRNIKLDEITDTENLTSAGTLVLYLESIKDDTTGNNPHVGNGTYDDGISYISGMSNIFKWSVDNKNFIGLNNDDCDKLKNYNFKPKKYIDNRKCWFFSDDYNFKYGKNVDDCENPTTDGSDTITFKETDITDKRCDQRNCNDFSSGNTECDTGLSYDVAEMLTAAEDNSGIIVGKGASGVMSTEKIYMKKDDKQPTKQNFNTIYHRTSALKTFDPENGETETNGEAAANSIVNVKNIDIKFQRLELREDVENAEELRKTYRHYIENTVVPYLTQMLPSTCILSWTFDEET